MSFLTFFDIFGQIVDFIMETLQKWPLGGLLEASGGLWGPKVICGGFGDVSFATEARNAQKNMRFLVFFYIFGQIGHFVMKKLKNGLLEASGGQN